MLAVIPFAIVGVCALPWVMLGSRRFGHLFGVPAVGVVAVLVLLANMVLGRFTGAGILISTGTVAIAGGVVGAVLATRAGAWRFPGRRALAVWVPALLGGAASVITLAIAKVLPGAAPLSWALNGDSNNNLYYAGLIIERNGVALGGAENPVPLTAALLALGIAPGRPTGDPAALLAHDFAGFGAVWVLLLAATALGMGAVAASIVQRSRIALVAVASTAGSLLPLTWFVAGLPIEYGYLNAHLVLPIALAAWLIYLASPGRIVAALALQFCIATLLLATRSPWVVLPAGFIIALTVRHWSTLRTLDARTALPVIASVIPAIVWLGVASAPALSTEGSAFEIPGHGLPSVVPVVAVALVLVATGDPVLRGFAFTAYQQYRDTGAWAVPPVEQLCDVVEAIGGPVRVITADAGLEASLQKACPDVDAPVEVDRG